MQSSRVRNWCARCAKGPSRNNRYNWEAQICDRGKARPWSLAGLCDRGATLPQAKDGPPRRAGRFWAAPALLIASILGMLKKAASGVLPLLPCSRTMSTLRASKGLRPCWIDPSERLRACFFEHSLLQLMMAVSSWAFICHGNEIFNSSILPVCALFAPWLAPKSSRPIVPVIS